MDSNLSTMSTSSAPVVSSSISDTPPSSLQHAPLFSSNDPKLQEIIKKALASLPAHLNNSHSQAAAAAAAAAAVAAVANKAHQPVESPQMPMHLLNVLAQNPALANPNFMAQFQNPHALLSTFPGMLGSPYLPSPSSYAPSLAAQAVQATATMEAQPRKKPRVKKETPDILPLSPIGDAPQLASIQAASAAAAAAAISSSVLMSPSSALSPSSMSASNSLIDGGIKKEEPAKGARFDNSLGLLTQKFINLITEAGDGQLDLNVAANHLGVQKRRIYDITNVLEGINLIEKKTKNTIQWRSNASTSMECTEPAVLAVRDEIRAMEEEEERLDQQISYAQVLLKQMSEEKVHEMRAFVTHADIRNIESLKDETIIAIRAPSGTTLMVPDPDEGMEYPNRRFQIYLQSPSQPIKVYLLSRQDEGGGVAASSSAAAFASSSASSPSPSATALASSAESASDVNMQSSTSASSASLLSSWPSASPPSALHISVSKPMSQHPSQMQTPPVQLSAPDFYFPGQDAATGGLFDSENDD